MPLWELHSPPLTSPPTSKLVPDEVLLEFDGLTAFTATSDVDGQSLLAYFTDYGEGDGGGTVTRFFVAPTTINIVSRLKAGDVSIRTALDQPITWLADVAEDGDVKAAWRCPVNELPPDALPAKQVMLFPWLEPLVRLRAIGPRVKAERLPTSVVKNLVSAAENATRVLVGFLLNRAAVPGRPAKDVRDLYELEAHQIAYGSFEMSFRPASRALSERLDDEEARSLYADVERLLKAGLTWASGGMNDAIALTDPAEEPVVLRALNALCPSRGAPSHVIEVTGRVAPDTGPVVKLTAKTKSIVREYVRQQQQDDLQPLVLIGVVEEHDYSGSFTLRDIEEPHPLGLAEVSVYFGEDHQDDVLDAHTNRNRVRVVVVTIEKHRWLLAIEGLNQPNGEETSQTDLSAAASPPDPGPEAAP